MTRRVELSVVLLWFLAAPLVAGGPKEVVARWEELAPLVEKREIETVLANGVHLRGRVEKVLPEALEVRVKRTSDPSLVPKGLTRVSRDLISALRVEWRQGPARALLAATGWYALWAFFVFGLGVDTDSFGGGGGVAVLAAGIAGGYALGRRLDTKSLRVVVKEASGEERQRSPHISMER